MALDRTSGGTVAKPRPTGPGADVPPQRPPRVWILNHYADAPDRPAGTRHYSLARAVAQRGGDVTIFAAGFEHSAGHESRLKGRALLRSQVFEGVRFVWVRTIPYRGNTWRRMANMVSYAVMVTLADFRRPAPDVVVGSTVHPFAALAGWVIAKRRRARFIYEVRDLWPQTLIDLGAMAPRSLGARVLGAIETFLVRRADTVITLLPGIAAYLEGKGLPSAHVRYLPNGADFSMTDAPVGEGRDEGHDSLAPVLDDLDRRRKAGEVVFAYVGAHGRVNRLEIVLQALQVANRHSAPSIALFMVGDGPEKPRLQRLAAELGLRNVVFVDPIPKARVPEFLRGVDVCVVHATATPVYRYGISFNKVFDYMAARKPIAFACTTINDPVASAGAGLSVIPDDSEVLGQAFLTLASASPAERQSMGAAGRAFVEREHDMAGIGAAFAELVGA